MRSLASLKITFVLGLTLLVGACTEPGQTTGVGAATGGVLGAGLGAIVGNQVGSSGAGLVIGAVAGSAAGAAVGNGLEAQEHAIQSQDEALERQQQMIRAQHAEIEEMRKSNGDTPVAARTVASNQLPAWESRPRGGSFSTAAREPFTSPAPATHTWAPAVMHEEVRKVPPPVANTPVKPLLPPVEPQVRAEDDAVVTGGGIKEKNLVADEPIGDSDSTVETEAKGVSAQEEASNTPPTAASETALNDTSARSALRQNSEARDQGVAALPPAADCTKAEQEIHEATAAADTSDQLFHYRRALRLCPESPVYHTKLGQLYVTLNRKSDAQYEFQEALTLDPNYQPAHDNLRAIQ